MSAKYRCRSPLLQVVSPVFYAWSTLISLLLPPCGRNEWLQVSHQLGEHLEANLLSAITPGFCRVRMDFDQQRIGSHRCRAFAHGHHQVGSAGALAGVDDDWTVRLFFDDGN